VLLTEHAVFLTGLFLLLGDPIRRRVHLAFLGPLSASISVGGWRLGGCGGPNTRLLDVLQYEKQLR